MEDIDKIAELIAKHGFPVVSAVGMAWFVYYVWTWATTDIKPVIKQANASVVDLIDKIRKCDNDIIRLHEKIETVSQFRRAPLADDYAQECKDIEAELADILADIAADLDNNTK